MSTINFECSKNPEYVSVPNQKVVKVHKKKMTKDFVQVHKEDMIAARKVLEYSGVYLYFILAGNADSYSFALSPKDIEKYYAMPASTCRDQIRKLIKAGYLVQQREGSNVYDFYETPHKV